jgi:hypothetical protein
MNTNDPPQFDRFDDIVQQETGIFSEGSGSLGDALARFDGCKTQGTREGVLVEMDCRHCGSPTRLMIEYGELVAIGHEVSPQEAYGNQIGQVISSPTAWAWSIPNQKWWPQVPCNRCTSPCGPMFTSEEARKHVQYAVQRRWLDPQRTKNLSDAAGRAAQNRPNR